MIFVMQTTAFIAPLLQRGVRGDLRICGETPLDPPFPKRDWESKYRISCTPRSRWCVSKTFWALALVALVFVGCRSTPPPTAFYILTSVTKAETASQIPAPKGDFAVGIGPVQLPEYLDRPQIVTRTAPDKITLSEFDRWGGSLRQDFPRVLAENVAALLGTDRVLAYPWGDRLDPAYRVALHVQQFDGALGGPAVLRATWIVTGREEKTPLAVRKSDIQEPVSGKDYDSLVAAQSRAVAALGREIAEHIRRLASGAGS